MQGGKTKMFIPTLKWRRKKIEKKIKIEIKNDEVNQEETQHNEETAEM